MLKSMTGFGKATCEYKEAKITVEIKSLNSKQGDFTLRTPLKYKEKEIVLRNKLLNSLHRGKVDISISIDNEAESNVQLNEKLIKEYYLQIKQAADIIGQTLENEQVLNTILRMPDVITTKEKEFDEEEWAVVEQTVEKAIKKLNNYRQSEGTSLEKDIVKRVKKIVELLDSVTLHEKQRIERVRERINQNLSEFLENQDIDRNRFEQEIIFYLEKYDITEEKVRLRKHCSYFIETIYNENIVGKKLGFISQEMGREINTLGSKANNADIQKIVVQMKEELEKIKEQLLNIL